MEAVNTMSKEQDKVGFISNLAYGLGGVSEVVSMLLGAFLMMFYTDKIGMSASLVGTMFLVSKVFDGITDMLAGILIDKTKSKWGKARPWLLWLSIPSGISIALIFLVPQKGAAIQIIYAFLTYNLFTSIFYTITGVAKNSLMALMTKNPMERGKMGIFSMFVGIGGAVIGYTVTIPFIMKLGGDTRAWVIVFGLYGALTSFCLLFSFLFTKETVVAIKFNNDNTDAEKNISFMEGVKLFVKNKYFIISMCVTIPVTLGVQLNTGSQMYFFTYAMENPMLMSSLSALSLIPTIGSIIFLAGPSLKYFGKKKSMYLGASIAIVSYIIRGLSFNLHSELILTIGTILGGIAVGPLSVPVMTLAADAVDFGEYLTGKRIEGIGNSLVTFSQKISIGLSSAAIGWVLSLTGYVANNPNQSELTKNALTWLFAYGPALSTLIVIIVLKLFYNYEKDYAEIYEKEQAKVKEMKSKLDI